MLYAGRGAALAGRSAGFELGIVRRRPSVVEVVVPSDRRVADQPGLQVRTRADLASCVVRAQPPRTRRDETVVDLLPACQDEDAVVGLLCDALRVGADPDALRELLAPRPRWRWRGLVTQVLATCRSASSRPWSGGSTSTSCVLTACPRSPCRCGRSSTAGGYVPTPAAGRSGSGSSSTAAIAHPDGRTDEDTWRDNDVVITSTEITLRYRWAHVAGDPCRTARQVAAALGPRGWTGTLRPCRRCVAR